MAGLGRLSSGPGRWACGSQSTGGGNVKLLDVVDMFLRARRGQGVSEKTIDWYRAQLLAFVRFLERSGVNGSSWMHPATIDAFLASERERVSASTLAARYRALRPFFAWVEERYELPSPMGQGKPPKVPEPAPRRADGREVEKLLASIPLGTWVDLRDRLLIVILDCCGLRAEELCSLALADFDLDAGVLIVQKGKGGDARPVPFLPDVGRALRAYLFVHPSAPGTVLFPSADGGRLGNEDRGLTVSGLRQMLKRRCEAAGVRYLNPHSFRHGLAMRLLNRGADMSLVQAILGHSRITTTQQHYARWVVEGLRSQYLDVMARGR